MVPTVLRNSRFARLWTAQSASQFGGQLTYLALPLAAYASTGSARTFASVFMASSLGIICTMLVGGALADRFDRQRMMLLSDAATFVVVTALGAAVLVEAWAFVAACAFLQTTLASLLRAGGALQRDIVADADRAQANALTQAALNASQLVAPLAGIGIFVRWGFLPIVAIDLATTLVSFLLLLGVRDPRRRSPSDVVTVRAAARRVATDVVAGGRVVLADRWLRRQLPGSLLGGIGNGMFIVAVIPWIDDVLRLPPSTFGVMLAVIGGSGLVASMLLARFSTTVEPVRLIRIGGVLGLVGTFVFVVPVPVPVIFVGLVVFGGCNVALNVGIATARQRRFRGDLQGRLGALEMVGGQASNLVGLAVTAAVVDVIHPATLMVAFGILIALSCAGDLFAARTLVREPMLADDVELALSA